MDRLDDPLVAVRRRHYVIRHWRGELSLVKAFWVNEILLTLVCLGLLLPLYWLMLRHPPSPMTTIIAVVLILAGLLMLSVWQVVGVTRSANRHKQRGGKQHWVTALRMLLTVGVSYSVYVATVDLYPAIKAGIQFALNPQALPAHQITLLAPDQLEVSGGLSSASLKDFERALTKHPGVKTIQLDSDGGALIVAMAMARLIQEKNLDTYTNAECLSACSLVFGAGKDRWLGERGRLGYHGAFLYGSDTAPQVLVDSYRRSLLDQGVTRDFIDRVMNTGSADMWFPTLDELTRERIVTATAPAGRFIDARLIKLRKKGQLDAYLQEMMLFRVLSQADPEFYQGELAAASQALATVETFARFDVMARKRGRILTHMFTQDAPATALVQLSRSNLDMVLAIQKSDAKLCASFIAGKSLSGSTIARTVPSETARRVLDGWSGLISAALQAQDTPPPGPLAKADLDEILRRVAERWPEARAYLRQPSRYLDEPDTVCQIYTEFYSQLLALPADRAGNVLRITASAEL